MELWDAYNIDFQKVEGVILKRGEVIPDGLYHLVCDIIVRHIDGEYLLMQRAKNKHHAGLWEATAGGSALKGEEPLECAIRELKEETGIETTELQEVGRAVNDTLHSIYVEYLAIVDINKDSIVLQEGETSAYKWVKKEELIQMKDDEIITKRTQSFISELNVK